MNSPLGVILISLALALKPWIQIHCRIGMTMTGSIASLPCETAGLWNQMEIPGSELVRSGRRQHWEQMTC